MANKQRLIQIIAEHPELTHSIFEILELASGHQLAPTEPVLRSMVENGQK